MIDSAFLNLVRGGRLTAYMGLKLDDAGKPKFSKNYTYIEIPLREVLSADGTPITKALRNQHCKVVPACELSIKGNSKILVKTNPKLQEVSNCPTMLILDEDQGEQATFYASFRKDFEISELEYAVRLYMFS